MPLATALSAVGQRLAVAATATVAVGAVAAALGFLPPVAYELAGSEPATVVIADYNDDGHLDFAVTGKGDVGELNVALNDGRGGFANRQDVHTGIAAHGLGVGDFNGDRMPDFAVTNGLHDATEVMILLGDGQGRATQRATLAAGKFPIAVAVADFNADGKLDLAVANNVLYGVTIFLGNGDGTFGSGAHVPGFAGEMATDVAAGDFNRDGRQDLALAAYYNVWILLGQGNGTFSVTGTAPLQAYPVGGDVALGDVTNDGIPDLALFGVNISVAVGLGNGAFTPTWSAPTSNWGGSGTVLDVDRDGRLDLVGVREGRGVTVYSGHGDGTFGAGQDFSAGVQSWLASAADVNEDGWPDLLLPDRNFGDTMLVSILPQFPGSSFALGDALPGVAGRSNSVVVGGATSGQRVTLTAGTQVGQTAVPGCPGLKLGVAQPKVLGRAVANGSGRATFSSTIPSAFSGKLLYVQAVQAAICQVSNLVQQTVH